MVRKDRSNRSQPVSIVTHGDIHCVSGGKVEAPREWNLRTEIDDAAVEDGNTVGEDGEIGAGAASGVTAKEVSWGAVRPRVSHQNRSRRRATIRSIVESGSCAEI